MSENNKAKHTIKNPSIIIGFLISQTIAAIVLIFMKIPFSSIIIAIFDSSVAFIITERLEKKYNLTNYVSNCVLISTWIFIILIEFGLLFIFLLLSELLA